ncbi:MAG TPA: ABC transporter permease [Bryobacteraceae bacterium]|jgi:predicted permease
MRLASMARLRLRSLFRRRRVEEDLDEEFHYHLEREIDENIAAGMSREEARLAALRTIGTLEPRKEECRDMRGLNLLDRIVSDIRFAGRQLRHSPEFALIAILMLALGTCASIAIFAFVDAALIKPLPYKNPGRLLGVFERIDPWCPHCNLSWPDYLDWKKENSTLSSLDIFQANGYTMTERSGVVPVRAARVSDGFFRTLGVLPALGRDFYKGEDQPNAGRTVILSYSTWQKRFSGQPDVIGKTVVLERIPRIIVGVLPKAFHFAPVGLAEFWLPFHPESECDLRRSCHGLYGVGRLKNGVSASAALANLVSIAKVLEKMHPDSNRNQGANVAPLSEVITGDIKPVLVVLMASAVLLLLIAIVNVTGLLLVRSENRKRELSVRMALGATSKRLLSQFATEALVLVLAGSAVGLVASHWTIRLLQSLLPQDMLAHLPFVDALGWNWRVAAFAFAIALLSTGLFALAPAFRLRMPEIRGGLMEGARASSGVWRTLGSKLVVLELATAVVLLAGAGLLSRSAYNLLHVRLGLQPAHLITIDVAAPDASYAKQPQSVALTRQLLERVAHLPGVRSAGLSADGAPVGGNGNTNWIRILGRPWDGTHIEVPQREVSPDYFSVLGAKLVRGRYFDDREDASKPQVAIINQAFARKYFPNEDPIGKQIGQASAAPTPVEIVGIVEDVREGPLSEEIPPVLYRPYNQSPDTYFTLIVRTSQGERSLLPEVSRVVRQIDPEIVTLHGMTMVDRIEESPASYIHRSVAWLTTGFAGLALLLALVGLYGVIAYSVSRRTREIGIRIAVGAEYRMVRRMILREAAWLAGIGIGLGLIFAGLAVEFLRTLLFGVSPWDPATMAGIVVLLAVASLIASFIPARRAASIDPVEALRAE